MEHDFWRQWQALTGLAMPSHAQGTPFGAATPGFGQFADAAQSFAHAARAFFESAQAGPTPAATAAAAQNFGNFLRDQFGDFFKSPFAAGSRINASTATGLAADAPALGLTREHQERAQRAADAWRRMEEAQRRLQRLWSDTLREAAASFAGHLGAPSTAPPDAATLNRLYDAWIDCAEAAYARTAHSDAFCEALADYVNAGSVLRRESNSFAEQWAKLLDLPTRNEINTLTQRLRSVEEELRAMRGAPKSRARGARKAKP